MTEPYFSSEILLLPFALQVMLMGVDELYFHRQRSLSKWERIGHPLDTLTVLFCLGWILFLPPSRPAVIAYLILAVISCVCITKDEKVHQQECQANEHWLHAVLFILHPIILLCAALFWPAVNHQANSIISYSGWERSFFIGNFLLTLGFGLYQFVYWNFYATARTRSGK